MSNPQQFGRQQMPELAKETPADQRLTLAKILQQVVEQQHMTVTAIGNISKELEYIRVSL